jgi:hypothetical protein
LKFLAESKTMKRWAIWTILIYALALIVLSMPVFAIAFSNWGKEQQSEMHFGFHDIFDFYSHWGYWLWLGVLLAGQALLLLLPINIAERRLPARRPLKTPLIVTAFFLANLVFAGLLSILCAIFKDDGLSVTAYLAPFAANGAYKSDDLAFIIGTATTIIAFWIIWAVVFRSFAKSDDENSLVKRSARWLLRGSILELLVAVPSHVIVRRRDDCCAPIGTFWGIVTGISVMLLCFGPGVYFLFVERCQKLKPKSSNTDKSV